MNSPLSSEPAHAVSPPSGGRSLVICLDGTNNKFGRTNTNVVRLYQSLANQNADQIGYYDPGVGTIGNPRVISKFSGFVTKFLGLGFGMGASDCILNAYVFLMRQHQVGDRIFIFGFSRGALEARALAALIHRCGILKPGLESLALHALELSRDPMSLEVSEDFTKTFSKVSKIHFLGLWDTVTSMGSIWSPIHWPNTTSNDSVVTVRHAIALDERRAFFRQNRWNPDQAPAPNQDALERWFPGVHCDIGGGYSPDDSSLWTLSYSWLTSEATKFGLILDEAVVDRQVQEARAAGGDPPEIKARIHRSMWGLGPIWLVAEFIPKLGWKRGSDKKYHRQLVLPVLRWSFLFLRGKGVGAPRRLEPSDILDASVLRRYVQVPGYPALSLERIGLTRDLAGKMLETGESCYRLEGHLPSSLPPAASTL